MDRWKSRGAKSQTGAESEGRKVRTEKIRRKKMQVCEKVGKSRNTVFFSMFCGSGGSKNRLAKAAGAETCGEMRNAKLHAVETRSRFWSEKVQNTSVSEHFWKLRRQTSARRCGAKHISKSKCTKHLSVGPLLEVEMSKKCTPLWHEAHFQVKMYKTPHCRTTFGSCDVEKVHAWGAVWSRKRRPKAVWPNGFEKTVWPWNQDMAVKTRFGREKVCIWPWKNVEWPWKPWKTWNCRRQCEWPWKQRMAVNFFFLWTRAVCARFLWSNGSPGAPLWREAHFEVKMLKATGVRTTFGGSDVASRGRRKGIVHLVNSEQNVRVCSIFNYNYHYNTIHSNTLQLQLHLHYILLHYTPLHYIALKYTQLHYTTLHYYTTLPSTTLRYTTLHSTTLQLQLHNYTPLHKTTLHYTTLQYITLHYIPLHYITLHYIPLHWTTLHYIPLHYTTLTTTTTTTTILNLHYATLHYTRLHYTTLHWMTLHHR